MHIHLVEIIWVSISQVEMLIIMNRTAGMCFDIKKPSRLSYVLFVKRTSVLCVSFHWKWEDIKNKMHLLPHNCSPILAEGQQVTRGIMYNSTTYSCIQGVREQLEIRLNLFTSKATTYIYEKQLQIRPKRKSIIKK